MKYSVFVTIALSLAVAATPVRRQNGFALKNGQDAIALNAKFKTAKAGDACTTGDSCAGDQFAQCVNGKLVVTGCAGGTVCAALPLVNAPGTTIACDTPADIQARIAETGANAGAAAGGAGAGAGAGAGQNTGNGGAATPPPANNAGAADNGDPQKSLTLNPKVIAAGFANNGQDVPAAGQVPSLTSTNNFINFCLTRSDLPLTDGKQIKTGSCNPAPIGLIPSTNNMPSSKFTFPLNNQVIKENEAFTISMAISKLETGNFVNAQANYFAAPQQLNGQGIIKGHSHVVVELMTGFDQTQPTDPNVFAFFKGLNGAAQNGILTAAVDKGLPAGVYRLSSINTAANHQPAIVPVAQHGSLDDVVYFEVKKA